MSSLIFITLLACRGPQEAPVTPTERDTSVRDALYFVLVDRYANGAKTNDDTINPEDPSAWHGGDLAGVRQHLDDIVDLGVGAVWLSPISATRTDAFDGWGAFHGYWTSDLGEIEPRFGTFEEARALSDDLHARDMRLLLDMVYNHVGYDTPRTITHPDWFHGNGDILDWSDPEQKVTHDVHGLPDLAQEHPEVYQHLLQSSLKWIREVQPDGFRVDAVGHLPTPFLQTLGDALRAEAGPSFALLGEYFEGDAYRLAERYQSDGFTSIFDFPLHYAMVDVFCRAAHTGRIVSTLASDRAFGPSQAPYAADLKPQVTFLDNHDVPRIASQCDGDLTRVALALAFQLTTRGSPAIYQGTEHGTLGGEDPANRSDMQFGDHDLKHLIRGLLDLRANTPSLHSGGVVLERFGPTHFVYRRVSSDQHTLIVVNLGDEPLALSDEEVRLTQGAHSAHQVTGLRLQSIDEPTRDVPKRSVSLWTQHQENAHISQSETSPWIVRAEGVPPELAAHIRLVGSGPEVGNWSPARAIPPAQSEPLLFAFDAPSDAVFALKLVAVLPDGTVQWSERSDHYASLPDSDAPAVSW